MEHHRLKPMKEGYDEKLFNDLYKQTSALRKKLAFEIDARKFGVDYQEVLSWFDVKFIHSFNMYVDKEPERLLGYIINSLTTYKYRIMRSSYQAKYHNHAHQLDISELYNYDDIIEEPSKSINEEELEKVLTFMKGKLNNDAILILEIELNPPDYILEHLKDLGKKPNQKIPHEVIADYLGYGKSQNVIEYIKDLRSEIKYVMGLAKSFFNPKTC